jgi:hypothetical protein
MAAGMGAAPSGVFLRVLQAIIAAHPLLEGGRYLLVIVVTRTLPNPALG